MTKALFKLFILFITCSTAISCSEQDSPELPDNSGNTNQGIASIDQTQINANGGGFIIRVKADGTWQASSSETWCTLSRTSGNGNGSISGYMKANTGAERSVIITITAGKEEAKFTLKQLAGNGSNPVPDPEKPSGYASMLEIPALKGGSMNQFITHTTKRNGKDYPTYSLEYSYKYKLIVSTIQQAEMLDVMKHTNPILNYHHNMRQSTTTIQIPDILEGIYAHHQTDSTPKRPINKHSICQT